ncbi:hypothetical protein BK026_04890 [Alteromonas sp. V450]|uniref:DUF1835 domain-containing protein n=1 Tax=Alteromonas sp. V450 TaxID=1912139 RepID=UPI0008FF5D05|nr:DUF1835 domain-containing protein [Alteromonas sp. V450]OJF68171.1 hypothetical protein BK026_04890 [Alteromonas sp. V450]
MLQNNPFFIDVDHQEKRAKMLLSALKHKDAKAASFVERFNASVVTSKNEISLADVQHAIATEHGLPNWNRLIVHGNELARHQTAITANPPALDEDMVTLHVRCGHDIKERLREGGFVGEFLALIDPLCIGPLPSCDEQFAVIRAQYIVNALLPIMNDVRTCSDIVHEEKCRINTLRKSNVERIVFWVEHDGYDQLMLLHGLSLLLNRTDVSIEIIELNNFPGTERFIGMGQLPACAIRACWQRRKLVNNELISQAASVWSAFRADTPLPLLSLLKNKKIGMLPNISEVIIRHLQELPHTDTGLSQTQNIALNLLRTSSSPLACREWFYAYQKHEPLPFLGDTMFFALMKPLSELESPLIALTGTSGDFGNYSVKITQAGVDCLLGKAPVAIHYHVGGISVGDRARWCWDHREISELYRQCVTP